MITHEKARNKKLKILKMIRNNDYSFQKWSEYDKQQKELFDFKEDKPKVKEKIWRAK